MIRILAIFEICLQGVGLNCMQFSDKRDHWNWHQTTLLFHDYLRLDTKASPSLKGFNYFLQSCFNTLEMPWHMIP